MRFSIAFALILVGCGGRTFVPSAEDAEPSSDVVRAPVDARIALDNGDSGASDAGQDAPDAHDAAIDASPSFGPVCMFGVCDKLAFPGLNYTCDTWCCNDKSACNAPKASLCSVGQCGAGNSNTTCAYADGTVLCCGVDRGCP